MIEPTERCASCGSVHVEVSEVSRDIYSSLHKSFRTIHFNQFKCKRCGAIEETRVLK